MVKVKKTHMNSTYVLETRFSSISHYNEPSSSLLKSAQSDPKMTPTCSRPRYPYASYIHPRAQNFLFVLRLAIFEIWTNFGKSASNDPITAYGHIVRPKGSIYILLTPPRPQFSLVPLYNQAFSNFIWPNFVKCTKWPQNIEHKWNAPDIYEWLLFAC